MSNINSRDVSSSGFEEEMMKNERTQICNYPEELVEEIRSKNDIVDVISSYVRLQKEGSSYFGLCPFHNENPVIFSQQTEADVLLLWLWCRRK